MAVLDALHYVLPRKHIERKFEGCEFYQAKVGMEGRQAVQAEVKQLQLGQVVEGGGDVGKTVALENQRGEVI